jgi:molybdopterin-guanine dinucleotide biosynthesis protein A
MDRVREDMTGVVLAGGTGRRMGCDKALIDFAGQPLLWRVAERLSVACATVVVAPGTRRLPGLPWPQVDDRVAGAGPLAGILGTLAVASTPLIAAVAVDMPHVDPALLLTLADAWRGQAAVVPVHDGRPQPLHAVYATSALRRLAAMFDAGERSPTRALRGVDALMMPVPSGQRWSLDLDTREDLARIRAQNPQKDYL